MRELYLSPPLILGLYFTNTVNAQQETEVDTYYIATWVFLGLLLLLYGALAATAYPYSRPRIPLFLFIISIFFPPFFFFLLIYLVITLLFYPIYSTQTVEISRQPTRSRSDVINAV